MSDVEILMEEEALSTRRKRRRQGHQINKNVTGVIMIESPPAKKRPECVDLSIQSPRKQAEANDLKLECGCCFEDVPFSQVVQCMEEHFFCRECVTRWVEVKIGEGSSLITVFCMKTDHPPCTAEIPPVELRSGLSEEMWEKFQVRLEKESIEKALLNEELNLEQCPFCDYVAELLNSKEENRIFICQNPTCKKESCRICGEAAHLPFRCDEIEKKEATDKRVSGEESLSRAVIRECPVCRAKGVTSRFVKETGCNKMTCPKCASLVCYLCEQKIEAKIGYGHFCQHPRDPRVSTDCDKCDKCKLWTSEEYDNTVDRKARLVRSKEKQTSAPSPPNPAIFLNPIQAYHMPAAVHYQIPPPNIPFAERVPVVQPDRAHHVRRQSRRTKHTRRNNK